MKPPGERNGGGRSGQGRLGKLDKWKMKKEGKELVSERGGEVWRGGAVGEGDRVPNKAREALKCGESWGWTNRGWLRQKGKTKEDWIQLGKQNWELRETMTNRRVCEVTTAAPC